MLALVVVVNVHRRKFTDFPTTIDCLHHVIVSEKIPTKAARLGCRLLHTERVLNTAMGLYI